MRPIKLPDKISDSTYSAKALLSAEQAGIDILIHAQFTKAVPRKLYFQQALCGFDYVQHMTGKDYVAVKHWQNRGRLRTAKTLGTAPLFDVGYIEHLLRQEEFAANDDELCDEAWVARLFWLWPPRHSVEIEPGSPIAKLFDQPKVKDGEFEKFVNEILAEVHKLRLAAARKQA